MICSEQKDLPELFGWLMERGCFGDEAICATADGFYAAKVSVAA